MCLFKIKFIIIFLILVLIFSFLTGCKPLNTPSLSPSPATTDPEQGTAEPSKAGVSITASPTTVNPGQTITVTYSGAPGNQKDFIAMYKVGVPNGQPYVTYQFLYGKTSGTLTFTAPQTAGDYEFRMFLNNTWTFLGKSNVVKVTSVSITASPTTVSSGQTITVTYSGAPGNQKDFIAMYKVGVPNGQPYVTYQFLYGKTSGTLTFTAPQTAGDYEFRMFLNNTWTQLPPSSNVVKVESSPNPPVHNITKNLYYSTIQSAIDSSTSGDTIVVSPGTYYENIDFKGKNITLESTEPSNSSIVNSTIIDGNGQGSVVAFKSGETSGAILKGFNIRNGTGILIENKLCGGGIYIQDSSPTILNNIIENNRLNGESSGGGIHIGGNSYPIIQDNVIESNEAKYGSGICVYYASAIISGNTIQYNKCLDGSTTGGGIRIWLALSSTLIENNIIESNEAIEGGGIEICYSSPIIRNNRIANNKVEKNYWGGGICIWYGSSPDVSGNIITGNEGGRRGGGIFISCGYSLPLQESKPTVNNNIIENNSADDGGGIYIDYYASPTITSNTIVNNEARYDGGGISVDSSYATPTISDNTITNNKAVSYGGGVYVDSSCDVKSIDGTSWPRYNFPPDSELTNTYSGNTHQNGLVTEGCHVYFLP